MKEDMEHMEFLCRLFEFSDIKIRIISFYGMVGSAIFTVISLFSESILGISAGFTRIGVYETFIHADDSPNHEKEIIWYA